jgi:hypothetical protein
LSAQGELVVSDARHPTPTPGPRAADGTHRFVVCHCDTPSLAGALISASYNTLTTLIPVFSRRPTRRKLSTDGGEWLTE